MAEPVIQIITGSAEPQPGTEAQWSATADIVEVANDITDNVGCIPPTEGITDGHKVTVRGRTDLGCIVYGIEGGPYTAAVGEELRFAYSIDSGWSVE